MCLSTQTLHDRGAAFSFGTEDFLNFFIKALIIQSFALAHVECGRPPSVEVFWHALLLDFSSCSVPGNLFPRPRLSLGLGTPRQIP